MFGPILGYQLPPRVHRGAMGTMILMSGTAATGGDSNLSLH